MPRIKQNKNLNNIIIDYLEYCNIKNLRPKTIKSYHQTLMLFSKYLEEELNITDVDKIKKEHVEEYITFTKERGKYSFSSSEESINKANLDKRQDIGKEISDVTINGYIRNIKAFFTYAEENNIVKKTNIDSVKFLKNTRKAKDQLTDDEYKKLIKSLDLSKFHEFRDYTIINLIFDTGMRLSETLELTIYNVDFSRCTIQLSGDITKGRKDRVVFFSRNMKNILQRWIKFKDVIQDSDLLFPTQRTNRKIEPCNFERNFRGYVARAKINKQVTPHVLRNNFARRFLLNNGSIYVLSKILGHSSVTVTEKAYLDVTNEDLRKKYNKYSPLENLDKNF